MPLLGAHVSAANGLEKAPANAAKLKLDSFQYFTRPPQSGQASDLTDEEIEKFLDTCKKHKMKSWHVHAPYIINLASAEGRIRGNSIRLLKEELRRADALKSKSLIAHVGSAAAMGPKKGLEMVIDGIKTILTKYDGEAKFAIETTAGSGHVLCSSFEEIAVILKALKHKKLAVCLDTAHIYAAGYSLDTAKEVDQTLKKFDKIIGLKHLIAVHLNDSKVEKGSRKDRHEHLGYGKIGAKGLMALLTDKRLKDIDFILETPNDEQRENDIDTARRWIAGEEYYPQDK